MTKILSINNLSISFPREKERFFAVNNISFELNYGETLGIVGESGSGKSVSCLATMGLLETPPAKIESGEILFKNQNLFNLNKKNFQKIRRTQMSMIFQEPMTSLNPVYTCGNQVQEVVKLALKCTRKQAKFRTLEIFEDVMLPNPEKIFASYPHQLSGGQKQRILIAAAMACKPELLIADEPTTALDVSVQNRILELLKIMKDKTNMSMIFITHDLAVASNITDNIAVMHKGVIVEKNTTHNILNNPTHIYTKGLIKCRPQQNSRPAQLFSIQDDIINESVNDESPKWHNSHSDNIYLKAENIVKKYKDKTAVDNVSFEVFEGETLGLVGESGCGKTSLGRTIIKLIDADNGKISIDNKDVFNLKAKELREFRKDAQIIFQDPYSSLNPRIPIGKAIQEPMKVHKIGKNAKERKQKVVDLLIKTGLKEEHYYHYPHQFSGGQRQRICIARALALNPKFIICDESVSALDVSIQAQVLNLLNKLKQEFGFTYIFISHDLNVVRYMSDRIMVMQNGKIVEVNDADRLYNEPKEEYTKHLISSIPKL